jgi:acetyl-CoA acetyltransferase
MNPFRGATAIVGIGQTPYYKRGTSPDPELKLALRAIVAACDDAGISPSDIDGFVSYGSDRNNGQMLMPALGTKELRWDALVWTHGGGIPGAVGLASAAIISGHAEIVVVYRAMAEGSRERLRIVVNQDDTSPQYLVNGMDGPAQFCALRSQRLVEKEGVPRSAMRALARASYYHAQNNPNAYGRGVQLDDETYEASRMISEPYHIFDCSRESDASAAVIVVSAARAKDLRKTPAYVLAAPMGAAEGGGSVEENIPQLTTAGFTSVAKRLWEVSGYGPQNVDVLQLYENMTGMAIPALVEHGFCAHEELGELLQFENLIAPTGKFPLNTSGGNLAEGFIHGMGLVNEAVRQIRGDSCNQVPGARLSAMTGGPGDTVVSSMLLGARDTL